MKSDRNTDLYAFSVFELFVLLTRAQKISQKNCSFKSNLKRRAPQFVMGQRSHLNDGKEIEKVFWQ